ncbi:ATP synthase subunit delta [Sporomusa ovata DSM 2662]|uniref:ATP synthase subunit delta n=1 Tax=Sporomusa ovata TaxID=2378 RepID=A0A0U1KVB1_9FIRM|nr:F0F1 ATP synthase subunit delta [Sporomusa ovata]EQB26537.1 F-type ATP synthase F1 complex subunit delta [Sporomusa ovata DSM 2662]CQR70624.1 ATP synthase delta chain [Sporomusa ovata]
MLTNMLALKYAQAVYELASEKAMLDVVEKQLKLVEATIAGHADLATLMYHPLVPAPAKKDTITRVFAGDLDGFVQNFLLLLIDKRREPALPAIISEYTRLANEARNIAEAEVFTAKELSTKQLEALAAKLSKVTGKNIVLKTTLDQELIGGIVVKIGDKLIDGSVQRQLKALKAALLTNQAVAV